MRVGPPRAVSDDPNFVVRPLVRSVQGQIEG